jgi:hypothetical protein
MGVYFGHQLTVAMRWTARLWGAGLAFGFLALAYAKGPPRSPDGAGIETLAQYALVGVIALGVLVAWRWQGIGGAIIVLGAAGLGVLASVAHDPAVSFLVFLALLGPGVLFLVTRHEWLTRGQLLALTVGLGVVVVVGGIGARRVYDYFYGPTHPESTLARRPVDLVEWVWSGGVTEREAVIHARLAHDSDAVRVVLSERPEMTESLASDLLVADDDVNDRVISARFDGLRPNTRYYYAVEADGRLDLSRQGRLRTFGAGPFSFEIAVGSCARIGSNGAVFDAIRALDPLLYLITGDFFYGDIQVDDAARYRADFDATLTTPAQAALYQSAPIAYIWDDHDYGANNAGADSPGRAAARRTYREYVPHYPLEAGTDGAIYQAFTIGRVRFILTDLRSERTPASAPDDAAKSMLGPAQKDWFKRELLDAADRYPLIVWVSAVPWIAATTDGGDNWSGYDTERREIADFIATHGIRGLVMLAGDAHMLAIDDGSNSDYSSDGGAGFPVMQAAALDRPGSAKGGPYSEGAFPGGGQFGVMSVQDDGGSSITVTLSGRDWSGREIVSYRYTVPVSATSGHAR